MSTLSVALLSKRTVAHIACLTLGPHPLQVRYCACGKALVTVSDWGPNLSPGLYMHTYGYSVYMYVYIYIYINVYLYIYIYICVCCYVYIYIYIFVHIYCVHMRIYV